jgi:hypothetical protein
MNVSEMNAIEKLCNEPEGLGVARKKRQCKTEYNKIMEIGKKLGED